MIETFTALLLAHVLADFVLQSGHMAANKRQLPLLAAHGGIVFLTSVVTTGTLHPALAALALLHIVIDHTKARWGRGGAGDFMLDQTAHLATLLATASLFPQLWASGVWSGLPQSVPLMALLAGAIVATRAGGFAVGLLMAPWAAAVTLGGLPGGGRTIGHLERGLIFLMVLGGLPEGIGFLIAAKSVLRFGTVREEAQLSEYVIIGTLASVGWALLSAYATLTLLAGLAPLGIPDVTP